MPTAFSCIFRQIPAVITAAVILAVSHNHTILSSQLHVAIFHIAHKTRFHLRIFSPVAPIVSLNFSRLSRLIQLIPATDHTLKMDNWTGGQALLSSPIHPYTGSFTPSSYIGSLHRSYAVPSSFSFAKHEKYPHIPAFRR